MAYSVCEADGPVSGKAGEEGLQAIISVTNIDTQFDYWNYIIEIWVGSELIRRTGLERIYSGQTRDFSEYFTMPASPSTILGWVYWVPPMGTPQYDSSCSHVIVAPGTSISIDTPATAVPGDTVTPTIQVSNSNPNYVSVRTHVWAPWTGDIFTGTLVMDETRAILAGETETFYPSFVMPSQDIAVRTLTFILVYRERFGWHWEVDNWEAVDIAVAAPPEPEFQGFEINQYITV